MVLGFFVFRLFLSLFAPSNTKFLEARGATAGNESKERGEKDSLCCCNKTQFRLFDNNMNLVRKCIDTRFRMSSCCLQFQEITIYSQSSILKNNNI